MLSYGGKKKVYFLWLADSRRCSDERPWKVVLEDELLRLPPWTWAAPARQCERKGLGRAAS